ncbi:hypothetical protein AbraIFM66950_010757 [Aspergillus brasiliensis]|nr:hypothetical protein AbraIFM66950_010757 [Aspergillus brasiliensis]
MVMYIRSGRRQPGSEISEYLHENGYHFGPSAVEDDFYDSGFGHGRFEEEIAENELKRRMMVEESAINLEVDLSSLGLDEKFDVDKSLFHKSALASWKSAADH